VNDTVLMIHGMWGASWYWQDYRHVFERAGYRCIAPSLRYHDVSPTAPPDPRLGTTSLLDYAADLEGEIRELDRAPIIMGHSMGGLLAQILASRGLAKALVLLTPASPAGIIPVRLSVLRSFLSVALRWGFWRRPLRQTRNAAIYSTLQLLAPTEQQHVYDRFVCESGRAFFEMGFWPLDSRGAARVDETKISCPTLVIGAAQDRITPASVVRRVAKKYRHVATYKEFPNHAHWVVGEPQWQEIAEFVLQWLRTVDANAKPGAGRRDPPRRGCRE